MPPYIRCLRAMRRRAWTLIALALLIQLGGYLLAPASPSDAAAQAAPIQPFSR